MEGKVFDVKQYAAKAREMSAEGIVMLRNEKEVLPLGEGTKVALFGRSQMNYYKSGTGSGGLVNVSYTVGIREALENSDAIELNTELASIYAEWVKEHPFDMGCGWATEPWFQAEMPLSAELIEKVREQSEVAIVVIGRTAGEDQDNKEEKGSYLLTDEERDMLSKVCNAFEKTVVLLNVGNIIDMKWVEEYKPSSVLYVWQGGQEGGNGVLDVLTGRVSPCGKLPDTIAYNLSDYPAYGNFGAEDFNCYVEDVYVGYRYFETFAKDKVMYPFGYGMSYTSFEVDVVEFRELEDYVTVSVNVKNSGAYAGKEVVQLYVEAPQGSLGKPARSLCAYGKTGQLNPGEAQTLTLNIDMKRLASYDDSGATGHKSCYVLEEGCYTFYAGCDVRSASACGSVSVDTLRVVEELEEAMAPVRAFDRMKPVAGENGFAVGKEAVPTRSTCPWERREARMPAEIPYTGNKGYKLVDVSEGKVSMEEFIGQLTADDLCYMTRGEGMSSPKVTAGTCAAYGGVTERLKAFGIPCACCTDGPSGIRMDCGTCAMLLPNGTLMASSFNDELVEELYVFEGLELRKNRIDSLLGPGMNIHRYPLNGRNFEYFSEDPLLTGKMAAAQLRGMGESAVTGTIKHFASNNQEFKRHDADSVVSERALREIYLKGFEIAVKEGGAISIMSTYNPLNGLWTASNYDLLTTVLRKEWGYTGIVMSDWWAKGNYEGKEGSRQSTGAMVRAQNDVYMVVTDSESNSAGDDTMAAFESGRLMMAELQRAGMNICRYLMTTPAFLRINNIVDPLDEELAKCLTEEEEAVFNKIDVSVDEEALIPLDTIVTDKGASNYILISMKERGKYRLDITLRATGGNEVAQMPLSVFKDRDLQRTITLSGADTEFRTESVDMDDCIAFFNFTLKLFFGQGGLEIKEIKIVRKESLEEEIMKEKNH